MKKRLFAAVLALVMVFSLTPVMASAENEKSATVTVPGYEEELTLTLTMDGDKIVSVEVTTTSDSEFGAMAIEQMPVAMVEQNSITVDTVSGATGTSTAILNAAINACAEINAGGVDLDAWALANGYVKAADYNIASGIDALASATTAKMGGVNYGAIEWTEELQAAAIREFLKGGKYLGSPDFAQDETGYNYREMYQMATSFNNKPTNTNLELVLNAANLHVVGVSETGTSKTLEFQMNPEVSLCWVRQIRIPEEELGYNYYCSYGVQINGTVRLYSLADLETAEGQDALIELFDCYYPTLASTWMGYSASFKDAADEAAVREGKLAYIRNTLERGASLVYEIIPSRIVITAPFLMNMIPQMANATQFTTRQDGEDQFSYELLLTDDFMNMLVDYKAEFISTEEGKAEVNAYYAEGPMSAMFTMLDGAAAQYGMPTSLEAALAPNSAAGLKTQTTWTPAE